VVWAPPARVADTSLPINNLRVFPVPGIGPEDVLVDESNRVLAGLDDGRVVRFDPATGRIRQLAETGGRPMGLEWLPDGRLLICDAYRGLLAAEIAETGPPATFTDGRVIVLTRTVDHRPVRICNNAAVAADGTIWFTDSSAHFDLEHWQADIIEHSGTGRLIRRDPDGTCETVIDGLQFANGVALTEAEDVLYFAETSGYSIGSLHLSGPRAGQRDVISPVLPGFPDNLSRGTDGQIWVAIASPRNALLDALAPRSPRLRKLVWALPERAQPKPAHRTQVLAIDPVSNNISGAFATNDPVFGFSTGVRENHGTVWIGSLTAGAIACFDLPG
jgi:sugar lactone lactonase YvrE